MMKQYETLAKHVAHCFVSSDARWHNGEMVMRWQPVKNL